MATYIPQYTGLIPNRATDTPQGFADNVYNYQVYLNSAIPAMNDGIREVDQKWLEVKNQAVSGGYSQSYIDTYFAHAQPAETITVTSTTELLNAFAKVSRKKFTGPVIIELVDGVYNITAPIYFRRMGEWDNWLIIRSQSGNKANCIIQYTGTGVMLNFDDNCVAVIQNLTFDGVDNTLGRELTQCYDGSILVSWGASCDVKNFTYGISAFLHGRFDIDSWNFIETLNPVRCGWNSIGKAIATTASITPNDAVGSNGATAWDNSYLDISNSTFTGFTTGALANNSSRIYGANVTVSNFLDDGILAYSHSLFSGTATIDGMNGTVVRGNKGLRADAHSMVECIGAAISNCQIAIDAESSSIVRSWDSSGTNITVRCVMVGGHSTVHADRFNCVSGVANVGAWDGSVAFTIGSNLSVETGNLNTWTRDGVVRQ